MTLHLQIPALTSFSEEQWYGSDENNPFPSQVAFNQFITAIAILIKIRFPTGLFSLYENFTISHLMAYKNIYLEMLLLSVHAFY